MGAMGDGADGGNGSAWGRKMVALAKIVCIIETIVIF
jgi:hypothetical protein